MQSIFPFRNCLHDHVGCLASWNVSLSCCEWEGVSCDRRTHHVVEVDLRKFNLSGAFHPRELFEVRDLECLNVSSNNFIGQRIPPELGLLKKLIYLNLSRLGFAGIILQHLRNMSSLTVLDLSSLNLAMLKIPNLSWPTYLRELKHLFLNRIDLSIMSSSWGQSTSHVSQLKNISITNYELTSSVAPSL